MWLRRDLRLHDHPALAAAAEHGPVLPVFVLDPSLLGSAGRVRTAALGATLEATSAAYDGALVIRRGRPEAVLPELARAVGATAVHVSAETTPYGRARDARVEAALPDGVPLVATGSPYAVTPGRVRKGDGTPYRVFTPFSRAWRDHGWRAPAPVPRALRWVRRVESETLDLGAADGVHLPPLGEDAARERWREFLDEGLGTYGDRRDRPDLDGTSRLSVHLKLGALHPRTLLADVHARSPRAASARTFVDELAWREFYADVLWHEPRSAWADLRTDLPFAYADPADDDVAPLIEAWRTGRTGFPFVDAGMRQLLGEGWMHNRVRMVTASFLVKDLHVWWGHGARHFLDHLADGDLASNSHGWQWVAGTGTDAAPYFRVFNPVAQGERFDPDGAYVRRWVPELRHLAGKAAHQPWRAADGYAHGYPERVVDHGAERAEALRRYETARGAGR
nr:deoxyribodipyrimidine photo-lyase [Cellulomonas sp. APG4]